MPPRKSAMIKGVDLIGEGNLIVVEPSAIDWQGVRVGQTPGTGDCSCSGLAYWSI